MPASGATPITITMATYTAITPQSVADIISASGSLSQEQKWAAEIAVGAAAANPYHRLIGGAMGGKPFWQIMDTRKLRGQEVHLQVEAPFGGAGKQGSGVTLVGAGEHVKFILYTLKIGVLWHAGKFENVAASQTTLGTNVDKRIKAKLKQWFAQRQGIDLQAEMHLRAHSRNRIYGGNKTSVAALRGADTFQPDTAKKAADLAASIMAKPLAVARKGEQTLKRYFLQGNNFLYDDMESSNDWQELLANSDLRGAENTLFTGLLPSWGGTVLDRWQIEFDTASGPQGNFDVPVAFTGSAITSAMVDDTDFPTINLLGGGSAAAGALTDRQYFWHFPNGPYTGFEGVKIAASTAAAKHALIRVLSGSNAGKFGMIEYTVNDGNKLVVQKVLSNTISAGATAHTTVGSVVYGAGIWTSDLVTDDFPIGSQVFPCNAHGQPYVHGTLLSDAAVVGGYGSIDGQLAMAKRTHEIQNHGRDHEIGCEMVWGCRACVDANSMVNGYVLITAAYNPPGFPGTV